MFWWRFAIIIAIVAALVLAGFATWVTIDRRGPTTAASGAVDMLGQPVDFDVSHSGGRVVDDSGVLLEVPSVGLSVPLGEMDEVRGEITPPGFTSAYVVRNRGVGMQAPADGTVYVVAHSVSGAGVGPGDYLIDENSGSARVSFGALVKVAEHDYRVTSSYTVKKSALPGTAEVWADVPGRLVIITCLQDASGKPSTKNVIIEAERV